MPLCLVIYFRRNVFFLSETTATHGLPELVLLLSKQFTKKRFTGSPAEEESWRNLPHSYRTKVTPLTLLAEPYLTAYYIYDSRGDHPDSA